MADREERFRNLVSLLYTIPHESPAFIKFSDEVFEWEFTAQDIKDLILSHIFEMPALRKELDKAHGDIETLQEQIACDGKSANEIDTVLKRALHHLERTVLQYAIEEAFTGDFKSLKERFRLKATKLFESTSLVELMALRKALLQQFTDEVIKRLLL